MHNGRHLVGKLYSYDQFGTIALANAYERFFTKDGKFYGDVSIGKMYVVRGDTIVLLGEENPIENGVLVSCTEEGIMEKLQEEMEEVEEEEEEKEKGKDDESDSDSDSDSSDEEDNDNKVGQGKTKDKKVDLKSLWKFEY